MFAISVGTQKVLLKSETRNWSEHVVAQEMPVTIHASENRSKLDSTDSATHAVKDFVIQEL